MTASAAMFLIDAVLGALLWPLAVWRVVPEWALHADAALLVPVTLYPLAHMAFAYALGLYRRDAILNIRHGLARLPLVVGLGAACATLASLLLQTLAGPAPDLVRLFGAASLCFAVAGVAGRLVFALLRARAMFQPRVLVIGVGARAWDLAWMLAREGRSPHYDLVFVHDPAQGAVDERLAESHGKRIVPAQDDMLELARRVQADQIVVAPDERRGMSLERLISCKTAGYPVLQYMGFLEREIRRIDIKRLDLSWVLYSEGFEASLLDRMLKRLLDVAVSLLILLVTSPFLLLAMAAIFAEDRGPVFYRQARVSLGGRVFRIVKLRTMRVDAEAGGAVWAAEGDRRITRIGGFLRRTRLDEVPQLFNVLKGEMSLVGPRPERPEFTAELARELPLYEERHMAKAGLTGWAQVNYPYGASLDDARSKLSYDLYYVKNFSVVFDLLILMQTVRVVIWSSGAR